MREITAARLNGLLVRIWTQLVVATLAGASLAQPAMPSADPALNSVAPANSAAPTAAATPELGSGGQVPPVIVPPRVIYAPDAVYPTPARDAGLEAEVQLRVTVGSDGAVSDVQVVEPVGNGFDEAARGAVAQFIFTPAQRNGRAMPAVIDYLYRFALPTSDVDTPVVRLGEATAEAASVGVLEGRVLVSGLDAALAGALVRITDAAGETRELYTDVDGRFTAGELAPGDYTVSAAADGFEQFTVTEVIALGEVTDVIYRLREVSEGIEVIVEGEALPREVTRRTLQRREITKVPGSGGDALRAIQSLPGVARPPSIAGLLIVRGASPQDTNIFFDGALVPIVYHFGGLSSVVPTELLDRIDFYPGNFSARYGRVTGGAIDVGLRSPNTNCTGDFGQPLPASEDKKNCYHGLAQLDLIDGRVLLQGPIAEDWSFAIAGRRSWVDAWLGPVLEAAGAGVTAAPVYYDYQAFVEHRPNARQKLRFQFYGSDDGLKILLNNPSAQDAAFSGTLSFSTAFYRGQVLYEQQLTPDIDLTTTLAVGRDVIKFGLGPLAVSIDTYPFELRTEFGINLFAGARLNAGIDLWAAPYDVTVRAPMPSPPGSPSSGPASARPFLEDQDSSEIFRPGWYLEAELQPSARLQLVPGFRIDHARDTGHTDLSPRINGRYILRGASSDVDSEGQQVLKTVVKGGLGYFYNPPEFQQTNAVFGTPGLQSNRALHATVGVEQELSEQVEVSVEGYWKDLDRQVVAGQSSVYSNAGVGEVLGAEVLLKYNADARFFGWVAYTLSKSTRQNSPSDEEYHFQFDQTHNLIVLGSYKLGDGWELGARFRVVSGNLVTPVQEFFSALYNADSGSYAPLQGKPFSRRLPLFHQLDIRLEKAWQFTDWRLTSYLDLWNAYNNMAVEGLQYNFDYSQVTYQYGLPILPSLGLRGEF